MNKYILYFKSGMEPVTIESSNNLFDDLQKAWQDSKNLTINIDQLDVQVMIRMAEVAAIICSKI